MSTTAQKHRDIARAYEKWLNIHESIASRNSPDPLIATKLFDAFCAGYEARSKENDRK